LTYFYWYKGVPPTVYAVINGREPPLDEVRKWDPPEDRLLDRIIDLSSNIEQKPAVPGGATQYLIRGNSALQNAKTSGDLHDAVAQFNKAIQYAPWWAALYFGRAQAYELLGWNLYAAADFERYLKLDPQAADEPRIRLRIANLRGK
jgi:tetratricopeptide (TPR) repeat protein